MVVKYPFIAEGGHMRKFALLAVLTAVVMVGVMGVSNAAPVGVIAFSGKAQLNSGFPCTSGCTGTAAFKGYGGGVDSVTHKAFTCIGCAITATYTYNEPGGKCVGNKVPAAALGTASGTITTYANPTAITSHFSWTRVGITAVVLLSNPTGVSVDAFIPPSTCKPTSATIAGVAAFA
jgi:hypothetical protein